MSRVAGVAVKPILIVGAGPVGMTAAVELSSFGVPTIVVDGKTEPTRVGSKAIVVQRNVLRILERLGCGALAERGVVLKRARTYVGEQQLFSVDFGEPEAGALPSFVNISQADTEGALLRRIDETTLVDLRWGTEMTAVRQDDDGVTLTVRTGDGFVELRGGYVLACDGAGSAMRRLLGIEFPGATYDDRFLIADIRAKLPFPEERRFFFHPPSNPGRQILIHPQPDDVWRIDWQVPESTSLERERASGELDRRVRALVGDAPFEFLWATSYRFHQRMLKRFHHGRIFFAGDAAHLMSPFGARGLNSGVEDVNNIAWKIRQVLSGRAGSDLLATYDLERRAAARENLRVTDATMQFMVPPTRSRRLLRDAILHGSLRVPPLRRLVNSGRLAEPHRYAKSPLTLPETPADPAPVVRRWAHVRRSRGAEGARVGAVAPDARCAVAVEGKGGSRPTRLRSILGDGFVALYVGLPYRAVEQGDVSQPWTGGVERLPEPHEGIPLEVYVVPGSGDKRRTSLAGWGSAPRRVLYDTHGDVHRAYAERGATFHLIRPDGHIALRRSDLSGDDVQGLLARLGIKPAPLHLTSDGRDYARFGGAGRW